MMHPFLGGLAAGIAELGAGIRFLWRGRAHRKDVAVAGLSPRLNPQNACLLLAPAQHFFPQHPRRVVVPLGLDAFLEADPEHGRSLLGTEAPFLLAVLLPENDAAETIAKVAPFLLQHPGVILGVGLCEPERHRTQEMAEALERFGLKNRFELVEITDERSLASLVAASGAVFWLAEDWEYPQHIFGAAAIGVPAVVAGEPPWLADYAVLCREDAVSAALEAVFGRRLPPQPLKSRWQETCFAISSMLH